MLVRRRKINPATMVSAGVALTITASAFSAALPSANAQNATGAGTTTSASATPSVTDTADPSATMTPVATDTMTTATEEVIPVTDRGVRSGNGAPRIVPGVINAETGQQAGFVLLKMNRETKVPSPDLVYEADADSYETTVNNKKAFVLGASVLKEVTEDLSKGGDELSADTLAILRANGITETNPDIIISAASLLLQYATDTGEDEELFAEDGTPGVLLLDSPQRDAVLKVYNNLMDLVPVVFDSATDTPVTLYKNSDDEVAYYVDSDNVPELASILPAVPTTTTDVVVPPTTSGSLPSTSTRERPTTTRDDDRDNTPSEPSPSDPGVTSLPAPAPSPAPSPAPAPAPAPGAVNNAFSDESAGYHPRLIEEGGGVSYSVEDLNGNGIPDDEEGPKVNTGGQAERVTVIDGISYIFS